MSEEMNDKPKKKRPTSVDEDITVDLSRHPDRFCGIAIQENLITQFQARECLNTQLEDILDGKEQLIGTYLIEAGYMTEEGINKVRAIQLAEDNALGKTQSIGMDRLGQIAVEEQIIGAETLEDVLTEQKKDSKKGKPKPLGHYIKKKGKASDKDIKRLRNIQNTRRKKRYVARRKSSKGPMIAMIVASAVIMAIALILLSQ